MQVLDTSAFTEEYHTEADTASIPLVQEELDGEPAFRFDAMEGSGMHIHVPDDPTVEKVSRAAAEADADLSDTDVRLVAAAFELDGTLVTADRELRTVAERLGVDVRLIGAGAVDDGDATFSCVGCGREFDEERDRCPVCGSDLQRETVA
ncbi:NOB1 family endonuclease [Halobaculum sp. P14]|uniref:NOB1 family endonuclease n=1 Tax=Halobaculum sp. P14 TaxID=3421638 RepID=UPI003EBEAFBA